MIIALKKDGKRVNVRDAIKGEEYFCPDCKSPLILRQGLVRIPHFAHVSNSENNCIFRGGGEGPNHDLMKTVVKKLIDQQNSLFKSEFEYRFDNGRIADICYTNRHNTIAIECVDKHTDLKDFQEKLEDFKKDNIQSMWIFDAKKFQDDNGKFKEEARINEIMQRCHDMNYRKIWAVDTEYEQIYAIHFEDILKYKTEYDFEKLKSTRKIKPHLQKDLKFCISKKSNDMIGPFCESFWKITTLKDEKIEIMDYNAGYIKIHTPLGIASNSNCDCINGVYTMLEKLGYSLTEISYFDDDLRKELKIDFEPYEAGYSKCFACNVRNRKNPCWNPGIGSCVENFYIEKW